LLSSQGDRVSLANSVENRAPFLDYKLVEFLKSVPYEFKLSKKLDEKLLLKQSFNDVVPKSVLNRTKQPYRSPDILPFRENWNKTDYLDLILSEKELKKSSLFNVKKVFMLTKLIKNKPIDSISTALSQSFIFLLTTRILEHSLQNIDYKKSHHLPPIKVKVDGTQVC
jgi:asparagine synthase (glutamine-hydrolysing)